LGRPVALAYNARMRYRLRTLLILLAVLPPLLWGAFALWQRFEVWRESRRVGSQPGSSSTCLPWDQFLLRSTLRFLSHRRMRLKPES
jgi:hypothetical protein